MKDDAAIYPPAAKARRYPSQLRLGFNYAQSIGVKTDRIQAFVWLSLTAHHGVGNALLALEGVIGQMSPKEREMEWCGFGSPLAGPDPGSIVHDPQGNRVNGNSSGLSPVSVHFPGL